MVAFTHTNPVGLVNEVTSKGSGVRDVLPSLTRPYTSTRGPLGLRLSSTFDSLLCYDGNVSSRSVSPSLTTTHSLLLISTYTSPDDFGRVWWTFSVYNFNFLKTRSKQLVSVINFLLYLLYLNVNLTNTIFVYIICVHE